MSATTTARVAIYVRTSTAHQTVENQLLKLREYIAARNLTAVEYSDQISGTTDRRPGLDALMNDARRRKFSTVLVWSLDRAGRTLPHLVSLIDELQQLGIAFVSLREGLDLSTAAGKLQLHILAALASFERERLRERTIAGLQRARNDGKRLGRREFIRLRTTRRRRRYVSWQHRGACRRVLLPAGWRPVASRQWDKRPSPRRAFRLQSRRFRDPWPVILATGHPVLCLTSDERRW